MLGVVNRKSACRCRIIRILNIKGKTGALSPRLESLKQRLCEIIILPQPVGLRGQVPVEDIAFLVLETPRDNDKDVAFADPGPLLDLSLDPAHPLDTIVTADADMVCTHHELSARKLFAEFLLGKPYTDDGGTVRVETPGTIAFPRFFYVIVN